MDARLTQNSETAIPLSPKLKSKFSRSRRRFFWLVTALLLLGWLLPTIVRVNYLQDEIATALSSNLGRQVRVGDIHPHLVSGWDSGMGVGLGVEIENVEIADDPRFGVEPLARIETLEARLAFRSIWHRRLEFSHVVLRNPSVNLVRAASGQLNLVALISERSAQAPHAGDSTFREVPIQYPDVRIVDGRLNFKIGNRKKSIHLTTLDVDLLAPRRADQPWRFEYSGTPSRASFEQPPAFVVRGAGQIGPFADGALDVVPLKFDWRVQDALLGEVASVLAGSNHGTHGLVSLSGEALGTTALLRISGRSSIRDLHRWDVILLDSAATEIPAEFSGVLDWHDDAFQLTRFALPLRVNKQESGRIELRGRIEKISSAPSLQLEADARNIPLAALAALAEPFAIPTNPSVGVTGTVGGHLNLHGSPQEWSGEVNFADVALSRRRDGQVQQTGAGIESRLHAGSATIRVGGGKFESDKLRVKLGDRALAQVKVSGDLFANAYRISLQASLAPLEDLLAWMPEAEVMAIQVVSGSTSVNLEIAVQPGSETSYVGRAQVIDAKLTADGLEEPLEIASARIQLKERTLLVHPFVGKLLRSEVRGSATIQLASLVRARPPHLDFDLQAEVLDFDNLAGEQAAEKPSWLSALMPSPSSSARPPALQIVAAGKLKAGRVRVQGFEFTALSAAADWNDGAFRLTGVSATLADGRVNGSMALRSTGNSTTSPASVEISATFRRVHAERLAESFPELVDQFEGELSGKLELRGSGVGWPQVWEGLAGGGEIVATNLTLHRWESPASLQRARDDLAAERGIAEFAEAKAKFEVADRIITLVQFEGTPEGRSNEERAGPFLQASGTIGFNKSVQIVGLERKDRQSAATEYRWTGTLTAPKLEESASLARNTSAAPPR